VRRASELGVGRRGYGGARSSSYQARGESLKITDGRPIASNRPKALEILQRSARRWDELRRLSFGARTRSEQLTYLLFLKMAEERTKAPYSQASIVPEEADWASLIKRGDHYRNVHLVKMGRKRDRS
jgi:hypothetical protein